MYDAIFREMEGAGKTEKFYTVGGLRDQLRHLKNIGYICEEAGLSRDKRFWDALLISRKYVGDGIEVRCQSAVDHYIDHSDPSREGGWWSGVEVTLSFTDGMDKSEKAGRLRKELRLYTEESTPQL